MAERKAEAIWEGTLREGAGTMKLGSGAFEGPYTYASRFESGEGTNPEELIGAAHAGCYSMFLSALLSNDGFAPTRIETTARVHLGRVDGAPAITLIELDTRAIVPNVTPEFFAEKAAAAKAGCPVSKALRSTDIKLTATLLDAS